MKTGSHHLLRLKQPNTRVVCSIHSHSGNQSRNSIRSNQTTKHSDEWGGPAKYGWPQPMQSEPPTKHIPNPPHTHAAALGRTGGSPCLFLRPLLRAPLPPPPLPEASLAKRVAWWRISSAILRFAAAASASAISAAVMEGVAARVLWQAPRGGGGAVQSDMGSLGQRHITATVLPVPEAYSGTPGLGSQHEDAVDFPSNEGGGLLLRRRWLALG